MSRSVVVLGGGLSGVATAYAGVVGGVTSVSVLAGGPGIGGLASSFER